VLFSARLRGSDDDPVDAVLDRGVSSAVTMLIKPSSSCVLELSNELPVRLSS
jgi:hypothetical protein